MKRAHDGESCPSVVAAAPSSFPDDRPGVLTRAAIREQSGLPLKPAVSPPASAGKRTPHSVIDILRDKDDNAAPTPTPPAKVCRLADVGAPPTVSATSNRENENTRDKPSVSPATPSLSNSSLSDSADDPSLPKHTKRRRRLPRSAATVAAIDQEQLLAELKARTAAAVNVAEPPVPPEAPEVAEVRERTSEELEKERLELEQREREHEEAEELARRRNQLFTMLSVRELRQIIDESEGRPPRDYDEERRQNQHIKINPSRRRFNKGKKDPTTHIELLSLLSRSFPFASLQIGRFQVLAPMPISEDNKSATNSFRLSFATRRFTYEFTCQVNGVMYHTVYAVPFEHVAGIFMQKNDLYIKLYCPAAQEQCWRAGTRCDEADVSRGQRASSLLHLLSLRSEALAIKEALVAFDAHFFAPLFMPYHAFFRQAAPASHHLPQMDSQQRGYMLTASQPQPPAFYAQQQYSSGPQYGMPLGFPVEPPPQQQQMGGNGQVAVPTTEENRNQQRETSALPTQTMPTGEASDVPVSVAVSEAPQPNMQLVPRTQPVQPPPAPAGQPIAGGSSYSYGQMMQAQQHQLMPQQQHSIYPQQHLMGHRSEAEMMGMGGYGQAPHPINSQAVMAAGQLPSTVSSHHHLSQYQMSQMSNYQLAKTSSFYEQPAHMNSLHSQSHSMYEYGRGPPPPGPPSTVHQTVFDGGVAPHLSHMYHPHHPTLGQLMNPGPMMPVPMPQQLSMPQGVMSSGPPPPPHMPHSLVAGAPVMHQSQMHCGGAGGYGMSMEGEAGGMPMHSHVMLQQQLQHAVPPRTVAHTPMNTPVESPATAVGASPAESAPAPSPVAAAPIASASADQSDGVEVVKEIDNQTNGKEVVKQETANEPVKARSTQSQWDFERDLEAMLQ